MGLLALVNSSYAMSAEVTGKGIEEYRTPQVKNI